MDHLEHPDPVLWDDRRRWFEELERGHGAGGAAPRLSEQACALMIELQAVFCAGAWASAILLAATIVDSQARFARTDPRLAEELGWLRRMRNALLHENPRAPVLTIEDQWMNRRDWERDAKRAVASAMAVLYPAGAIDERGTRER